MSNSHSQSICHRRQPDSGFTLLEMVVAILILSIGLLGVASAIGFALMASNSGRGLTNAKLLVVSALEQMETLRDSGQLNFAEIKISAAAIPNAAPFPAVWFTGFAPGFQPVSTTPGADFVYGSWDDPGRTDPALAVKGVTRKIEITDESLTLKKIKVTLQYVPDGGTSRELVCVSYLNDNAHGNFTP